MINDTQDQTTSRQRLIELRCFGLDINRPDKYKGVKSQDDNRENNTASHHFRFSHIPFHPLFVAITNLRERQARK